MEEPAGAHTMRWVAMPEPIQQTLAVIAANFHGTLLAYTPLNDAPDDHRYAIAYGVGRGAWVCATVDAISGRRLDGAVYRVAPTPAAVGVAFATAKGDPEQQGCVHLRPVRRGAARGRRA
jgi:hypothetical protein